MGRSRLKLIALVGSFGVPTESFLLLPAAQTSPIKTRCCSCSTDRHANVMCQNRFRCTSDNSLIPTFGSSRRPNRRTVSLYAKRTGDEESKVKRRKMRQSRAWRSKSTFSTAVCIVPPDDAWDTIQRARHLARDTSFYKWPAAIRLFHPFAPKSEIPSHVGKLAEWIDEEGLKFALGENQDGEEYPYYLEPFEVTLDSIQILPHWEILDARIDALEDRMSQQTVGESVEELERRSRREAGRVLIEQEVKRGKMRKKERDTKHLLQRRRDLKKELKQILKEREMGNDSTDVDEIRQKIEEVEMELELVESSENATTETCDGDGDGEISDALQEKKTNSFDGPCVIYLSPNEQSCVALDKLRERLRSELFPSYDAFSPSSSVSPYPEQLPRKALDGSIGFRPLLPIARFPSVEAAVKVAKVLQKAWDPLSFNVTDIQFISRNDDDYTTSNNDGYARGTGFGASGKRSRATQSMAVTTSGEVEDVSKHGVFGCDAMVMLLGEEPEEELMEEDASLTMIMDDASFDDTDDDVLTLHGIDYNKLFATAEREYQRMKSHEELSSAAFLGRVPIFSDDDDLEKWLDTDDGECDDEGATAVVGRAQFFVGSMREFIGMPASSTIDQKERIMGGGVNSIARRKGSVQRKAESWDSGDYGRKDQDLRG